MSASTTDLDALALQELGAKRAYLSRLQADNAALRQELAALHSAAASSPLPRLGSCAQVMQGGRARQLLGACLGGAQLDRKASGAPRRYNFLALFLHLLGLALLFVPLGGGGSLAGGSAAHPRAAQAVDVDLVLVVPTTSSNHPLHDSVRAQFRRGDADAGTAALLLVHGGSGGGSSAGDSVIAPGCGDGPLVLPSFQDGPGDSWRYHTYSHFTCKLMEGLCAATQAYTPRFVAVASEEALFRWQEFLRARAPRLPSRGVVFTRYIEKELHRDGLPPSFWNKGWPILPTFNNSVVLSRDVATTLCTLHRSGKLLLYGPPELFLGGILSTLEGLSWVMEESVTLESSAASSSGRACSTGITVVGFKGPQDWARCPVA